MHLHSSSDQAEYRQRALSTDLSHLSPVTCWCWSSSTCSCWWWCHLLCCSILLFRLKLVCLCFSLCICYISCLLVGFRDLLFILCSLLCRLHLLLCSILSLLNLRFLLQLYAMFVFF